MWYPPQVPQEANHCRGKVVSREQDLLAIIPQVG